MKNYYALLSVSTAASAEEIARILNERKAQCQKLTAHTDQTVVDRAKQYLALLQEMETTLLSRQRRAEYDAALGLAPVPIHESHPAAAVAVEGKRTAPLSSRPAATPNPDKLASIGTLPHMKSEGTQPVQLNSSASPAALSVVQATPMIEIPASVPATHIVPDSSGLPVAWLCEKCQTPNPPKSRHCEKCGARVGKLCPKCSVVVPVYAAFCSDCGADIGAYEAAQLVAARRRQNADRIAQLESQIATEKANLEDWEDAYAGSFRRSDGEIARKYKRICSSNTIPNLWWLWILLSIIVGVFCGLVLRIPPDIAMYIGLGVSLPAGLAVMRAGGGCYASLAVWAVGGSIAAAVVAWGTQFMIGILCGLLALPIIYLLGKSLSESNHTETIKNQISVERENTRKLLKQYEKELQELTGSFLIPGAF